MTAKEMLSALKSETINTWFDLGLFVDRIRDTRGVPAAAFAGFLEDFRESIAQGGMAFVSFYFAVDGVTNETRKYVQSFQKVLGNLPVYYISGEFRSGAEQLLDAAHVKYLIDEMRGFDDWPLYNEFFHNKLERGSPDYNSLIGKFWSEVLVLAQKLGTYIEKHNIRLLYLLNVCSNPGNVSLSLAAVLVSELLGIPVINNNHDFYWEGGTREIDIDNKRFAPGPRDFFFKNSDIGEFFSIIEVLFPWESRSWITVNINQNQCRHVVDTNGHNPASVLKINTAVDIGAFQKVSKQQRLKALYQISAILSGYRDEVKIHTPDQVLERFGEMSETEPVLIGAQDNTKIEFANNNIIFLQPTRIMARKRIEVGFRLIQKLFKNGNFRARFDQNPQLRLTLLVTGPIAVGHRSYFETLVAKFAELLQKLPKQYGDRTYLALLFSEFDKKRFIDRFRRPFTIPEIYNIASLILLPSETEGRGLPIIEAATCGVPIFCCRYYPEQVYDEVIGSHLGEKDRLRVLEFSGSKISSTIVKKILAWVFTPQQFVADIEHNRIAVQRRFSQQTLEEGIKDILDRLYAQLKPNEFSMQRVASTITEYKHLVDFSNRDLRSLINVENRHYLPGYGRMAFMLYLKSLIDPSYFRAEEQTMRGFAMGFAMGLVNWATEKGEIDRKKIDRFYNSVDNIFLFREGEVPIRHDHSLAYRHRNRNHFPYQDFTFQELTGLINMLFHKVIPTTPDVYFERLPHMFTDPKLALFQLTNSANLAVDDRDRLLNRLGRNTPIALFPGEYIKYELSFFAVQHVRDQLQLGPDEELTKELLDGADQVAPVHIFCPEKSLGARLTADALKTYVRGSADDELRLLFKQGFCRIVRTHQWCVGIHFPQLGATPLKVLRDVRDQGGFIVAIDNHAALMTDIVDLDRFHIGRADDELAANILGIPNGSGYVQFAPAGVRTTLAYPTPVQTAFSFSRALRGPAYQRLAESIGEAKLLSTIKEDAQTNGSPIEALLGAMEADLADSGGASAQADKSASYSYVSGVYKDLNPWNGATANVQIGTSKSAWIFATFSAGSGRKQVTEFAEELEGKQGCKVEIAWNGGYILNAELVGKLGLPESYIGSPLGLVVADGKILCPPLFNKPAFLIYPDGHLDIKRVNCLQGFALTGEGTRVVFAPDGYNIAEPARDQLCYYDLMYEGETVKGNGRIVARLAGNVVKEVIHTKAGQQVPVIPVGLTLSFPEGSFPADWEATGKALVIEMPGFENIQHAVEAGPLLVDRGRCIIDMEAEGWKKASSIKTQAARLDFTDMRGPKIAIGLDDDGNLHVLTINGRIRESVGASHIDMAEILIGYGITKGMGFDPGGSSTLVVNGRVLNISPYNSGYEANVYSLPPEPRPVGNAVLGWRN